MWCLMPRLHMQVWQPGTERKACKNVFLCCQAGAIFCLWRGQKACFILQAWNLSFKTWKAIFTNVRFRSWSSKPLSVNAALTSEENTSKDSITNNLLNLFFFQTIVPSWRFSLRALFKVLTSHFIIKFPPPKKARKQF